MTSQIILANHNHSSFSAVVENQLQALTLALHATSGNRDNNGTKFIAKW